VSWDGESAEARVTLLGALEDGLSVQDEPLIMRAVSDARKEVRQVALRLIRRMPGSSFAERWRERARAHVMLKKAPLGRRLRVEVREPAFEPSWAADGAEQRAPKGTGQVAWWLQQLVALAPPDTWPDDALPAVLSSDWAGPLVAGLAESAEAYRHPAWSGRLIIAWAAARAKRSQWPRLDAAGLLAGMPPSAAESVLRQALQEDPTAGPALVPGLRHAWSEDFSRFFARRLADLADQWSYAATGPLSEAALRLDPSVLPDAQRSLDNPNPHAWTAAALERLVRCLDYRQQMRRELAA
jgi:hypothetical protein